MYTFPDNNILFSHLSEMLKTKHGAIEIISRSNFLETSTFPVEIVVCKTENGKTLNLFCKYLAGMGPNNFGHRGGVEYEANIYEKILDSTQISKIEYYGQCRLSDSGDLLLVIEYLGEILRMLYSGDDDALVKAATWIGTFHRLQENNAPDFVTRYNKEYYFIWSERFKRLTQPFCEKLPWLLSLAEYYENNIGSLLFTPQTIIHGEFYPRNILLKNGIIYVVDWESAAVAPGEIDLASLIEGWGEDISQNVKSVYIKSRWPDGKIDMAEFEKRILLTQIYFHFWWWEEKADISDLDESEAIKKLDRLWRETGLAC